MTPDPSTLTPAARCPPHQGCKDLTSATEANRQEIRDRFARALNDLLAVHKMSRPQLAERVGGSPSTVTNWAKGRDEPRPGTVFAIEDAFHLPPGTLARTLGYGPPDTRPIPSVEEAILNSDLPTEARQGLLGIYRALVFTSCHHLDNNA